MTTYMNVRCMYARKYTRKQCGFQSGVVFTVQTGTKRLKEGDLTEAWLNMTRICHRICVAEDVNGYKDKLVLNCEVGAVMAMDTGKRAIPREIFGDGCNWRCVIRTFEM